MAFLQTRRLVRARWGLKEGQGWAPEVQLPTNEPSMRDSATHQGTAVVVGGWLTPQKPVRRTPSRACTGTNRNLSRQHGPKATRASGQWVWAASSSRMCCAFSRSPN